MLSTIDKARNAVRLFEQTGAKFPKPFSAVQDRHNTYASNLPAPNHEGLSRALVEAYATGQEPSDDSTIVSAAVALICNTPAVRSSMQAIIETEYVNALKASAPAMLASLVKPYANAVEHLTEARAVLGDTSLDDTRAIVQIGGDAAEQWAKAKKADADAQTIVHAWLNLAPMVGVSEVWNPAAAVEWDANEWVSLHHSNRLVKVKPSAWENLREGWTLRLATLADIDAFTDAVATAQQRYDQAMEKQSHLKYKQQPRLIRA